MSASPVIAFDEVVDGSSSPEWFPWNDSTVECSSSASSVSVDVLGPGNEQYWGEILRGCSPVTYPVQTTPASRQEVGRWNECSQQVLKFDSAPIADLVEAAWARLLGRYCDTPTAAFLVFAGAIEAEPWTTIRLVPIANSMTAKGLVEAVSQQRATQDATRGLPYSSMQKLAAKLEIESVLRSTVLHETHNKYAIETADHCCLRVSYELTTLGCRIIIRSHSSAIDPAQARRLCGQLCHTIEQLSACPNAVLDGIQLASPGDLEELVEWNGAPPSAVNECIHELVATQCRCEPDKPALESEEGVLTFAQLIAAADRLAVKLIRAGVLRGSFVPLLFEKSISAVIAMLAVLKVGAAFAALDPSNPATRLKGLAKELDAKLTICSHTQQQLASTLTNQTIAAHFRDLMHELQAPVEPMSERIAGPGDTAFVLFTSGSTGRPKGICITHQAFSSSMAGHGPTLRYQRGGRNFQYTAYTSDVSMGEIFTSLTRGACVCIPSEHERLNDISGAINRMRVDWAFLTPTVASLLKPDDVPGLRTLVYGGEVASPENISEWADRLYLINSYGPAETSIWTTCSPGVDIGHPGNNIGRRMGCLTWVVDVDNYHRLAPIGVVGELIVEGPILAKEYLHDPQKTADAFVHDPAWRTEPCRLYRTGDLVRYNSSGDIIFLGRKDLQVKLRAQRIQLPEIEFHVRKSLTANISGSELAVDLVKFQNGQEHLVVFLSLERVAGSKIDHGSQNNPHAMPELLKGSAWSHAFELLVSGYLESAKQRLPQHMIPYFIAPLATMPLSASAKVNRKALRELAASAGMSALVNAYRTTSLDSGFKSNREEILAQCWATVLSLEAASIAVNDNFFALGGASLDAMRLVRAAKHLNVRLDVKTIFEHPNLRDMAAECTILRDTESPELTQSHQPVDPVLLGKVAAILNMPVHEIEEVYPCTANQEAFMIASSAEEDTYVSHHVFSISNGKDGRRFVEAFQRLVQETALLRTTIVHVPGLGFQQVVLRHREDFEHYPDSLDRYFDAIPPFAQGEVLSRFRRVDKDQPKLLWSLHHALHDSWTLRLLLRRASDIFGASPPSSLSSFRVYSEFAHQARHSTDSETFWQRYLEGGSVSAFPSCSSSLAEGVSDSVLHQSCDLPPGRPASVTTSVLLSAAWALLISHYCDSSDVLFATAVNGRDVSYDAIEDVLGPTLCDVPVRLAIDQDESPESFLRRVQLDRAQKIPHQSTGLAGICKAAGISAEFTSFLVVQSHEDEELAGVAPQFKPSMHSRPMRLRHPLNLECVLPAEKSKPIYMRATYNDSVLSRERVTAILRQFAHITQQLCNSDTTRLRDIDPCTPADLEAMLQHLPPVPAADQNCVHEAIRQQCKADPSKAAVEGWDATFTYHELDRYSDEFATRLRSLGVGPECLVGLHHQKSGWAVVAMLAILKAGAGMVPLDPAHPVAARKQIIGSAGIQIVVCSHEYVREIMSVAKHVLIMSNTHGRLPEHAPSIQAPLPSNVAFVLFTSGTTGKPKGIVIEHQHFVSSVRAHSHAMHLNSSSRSYQYATYTFDHALFEIFTTLIVGGTVCVPSDDDRFSNLAASMRHTRASWAFLTSSVCSFLHPDDVPDLKTLALGGERIPQYLIDRWAPQRELLCGYGPSEASVCCVERLMPGSKAGSVGRPIGSRGWIVSPMDHDRLLPYGMIGELIMEGPVVAREYLADPATTEKSFIPPPSWTNTLPRDSIGRFFKTGDLVRWSAKGVLELFGRKDSMTKIHGQRIELSEVEAAVTDCLPSAGGIVCDVVSLEANETNQKMVAFVITESLPRESFKTLNLSKRSQLLLQDVLVGIHSRLEGILPGYKIPSAYVPICRIPLTSSGKTDRKALRAELYKAGRDALIYERSVDDDQSLPQTHQESILSNLWTKILGISPGDINRSTNFVQVGGDSISAMLLSSSARRAGYLLTVSDILRHGQLHDMACQLTPRSPTHSPDAAIPSFSLLSSDITQAGAIDTVCEAFGIVAGSIEDIYPLTSMQQCMVEEARKRPGVFWSHHAFSIAHHLTARQVSSAWQKLSERHEILRSKVFQKGPHLLQAVLKNPFVEVNMLSKVVLSDSSNLEDTFEVHRRLACSESTDLSRQYLDLLHSSDSRGHNYLLWTVPHHIFDGVSLNLLVAELDTLLSLPDSLPALVPPQRYAAVVRELNTDKESAWSSLTDNTESSLPSLVVTGPSASTPDGDDFTTFERIIIPPGNMLPGYTLSTILLAAFAMALTTSGLVDSSEIQLATTFTGRNLPVLGIENIFGPILHEQPLRIPSELVATPRRLLEETQSRMGELLDARPSRLRLEECRDMIAITIHPFDILDAQRSRANIVLSQPAGPLHRRLAIQCTLQADGKFRVEIRHRVPHVSSAMVCDLVRNFEVVLEEFVREY